MDVTATLASRRGSERLLGLAVSPYVIAGAVAVAAAGVAMMGARSLSLWLVVAAGAAGWSSAWSP